MKNDIEFTSQFSDKISGFIAEKRGMGYKYNSEASNLKALDQFIFSRSYSESDFTKEIFEQWTAKRIYERDKTCEIRRSICKQLCKYIVRTGGIAYIPQFSPRLRTEKLYRPYIFNDTEIANFLAAIHSMVGTEQKREVFRTLFSLLICTGMRLGEVLRLEHRDIEVGNPVLVFIRNAKFDKDRRIPLATKMSRQLSKYLQRMELVFFGNPYLFPSSHGIPYSEHEVYMTFRHALWQAGISHGGRGKGPRIHDFRHTFAVKSLRKMVFAGEDIMAVMPLLSQYLGHKDIYATQTYLQFTAEMFPTVTSAVETSLGDIIPGLEQE